MLGTHGNILKTYGNILGNRGNYWENGGQSLFVCCDFSFWRDIYDIPTLWLFYIWYWEGKWRCQPSHFHSFMVVSGINSIKSSFRENSVPSYAIIFGRLNHQSHASARFFAERRSAEDRGGSNVARFDCGCKCCLGGARRQWSGAWLWMSFGQGWEPAARGEEQHSLCVESTRNHRWPARRLKRVFLYRSSLLQIGTKEG